MDFRGAKLECWNINSEKVLSGLSSVVGLGRGEGGTTEWRDGGQCGDDEVGRLGQGDEAFYVCDGHVLITCHTSPAMYQRQEENSNFSPKRTRGEFAI